MKIIAIMNHFGVLAKEAPVEELHKKLVSKDYRIIYPEDVDDLMELVENNAKVCGIIFD
ncbi:Lysine decarboxylase [Pseudocitrobacter vendiensis]|uniref:Lysine decarboxylase n=1 Tax=Pseudocitrobacter vendiensis TaxID=2488306 RepID=A0ABM9F4U4_9ENTR|nr:Lysine decarboxylase [Pseudocitrobacter vendiensis]